jgi:hypothetical protein
VDFGWPSRDLALVLAHLDSFKLLGGYSSSFRDASELIEHPVATFTLSACGEEFGAYLAAPFHSIKGNVMKFQQPTWLFKSPGPIPTEVVNDVYDLITTMASQAESFQDVLEDFKNRFAGGQDTHWSSSASWAQTDLRNYMSEAADNAPKFIAAFVDGCLSITKSGGAAPDTDFINELLAKHNVGYQVDGDTIVSSVPIATASAKAAPQKPAARAATQARKLRVFLCHSSGDKPAVRKLYKRLKGDGFEPWLDEENLIPGQDWDPEIRKAVKNSHVVIVCLSTASINKAGYAQKEIVFALDAADEQPEGTIFIIPARLEECRVPDRLKRWHYVNLFDSNGYQKLMEALQLRAGGLK